MRDLASLDPAKAGGRGALFVVAQVFDSLTSIDPVTGEPVPAAAKSWAASADGLTWTFRLATATFHNGAPVTAGDFKFAFDRVAMKATGSSSAFELESVKGFREAKVAGTASSLTGVKAVDASTLRISLSHPLAELPVLLADPGLAPIPAAAFKADSNGYVASPIGNGPFRMVGRNVDGVDLARFEGHAGGSAYLDRIQVRVSSDVDSGWRDFAAGRTDVAEAPASVLQSSPAKLGVGGVTPLWGATYYGFNLRLSKFKDPNARRAISMAIDRAAIVRTVYESTKIAATGIVPRDIGALARDRCASCNYDQPKARTLLKSAFGSSIPSMTIDHLDASPSKEVAAAIAVQLREVGISVALRGHTASEYTALLQKGGQEIAELGWLSEVPSPDGFLAQQLGSQSADNQTAFSDSTFDSLITKARATQNETSRREQYRLAEARALDLMPLVPIVFFRNHVGVSSRVRNVVVDGAGLFDAWRVWIPGAR